MTSLRLVFITACTLLIPNALLAQAIPDLKSLSDEKIIALFNTVRTANEPDFCGQLSPLLGEMLRRPTITGPTQEQKTYSDFRCALDEQRWTTAYRLMSEIEKEDEGGFGTLGLYVAINSNHPVNAAQRMTALASAKDGEQYLSLEDSTVFRLLRDLWTGGHFSEREKLVLAMMNSRHFKKMSTDVQMVLIGAVIDEEGRSGRFKRSAKLLDEIDSPSYFIGYLSMKQFAPIWAQVEKAAGANMAAVTERQLKKDMAKYKSNPEDRKAFNEAAHALHFAGKFEEVITHVGSFDHSAAGIAKATEDDAWALNVEAYALDSLGRHEEAETIFDRIAAIPYDPDTNGWLVNFTINRGSRLVELGQWEKGLQAATLAGQITEKSGSPFAKMLVRRDKICALNNLGKGADAKALAEEAFEARKDSYSHAAAALLCAGDNERAAQVTIEALSDPVYAEAIASDMQKSEFELFYTQSKLPTVRDVLLPRPDVRAAYDKVARDIPDAFIPLAGKRRRELELVDK